MLRDAYLAASPMLVLATHAYVCHLPSNIYVPLQSGASGMLQRVPLWGLLRAWLCMLDCWLFAWEERLNGVALSKQRLH